MGTVVDFVNNIFPTSYTNQMCPWYSTGIEITTQKVLQEKGEHLMRAEGCTHGECQ